MIEAHLKLLDMENEDDAQMPTATGGGPEE